MNTHCSIRRIPFTSRALLVVFLLCTQLLGSIQLAEAATQVDIIGPHSSAAFGSSVTVLPNGNFVVTDLNFSGGIAEDVGVVYLYDGVTLTLLSTLTGMSAGDRIGSGGIAVLRNGNYVIRSPYWDNGVATDAGAITWADQDTGVSGVVSAANSLVGTLTDSWVGWNVVALANGNFVVVSSNWDSPIIPEAGAVTWGSGDTGVHGEISAANSLVGTFDNDSVGSDGVIALTNGNYVVCSSQWDNGGMVNVGAATWGNGLTGKTGHVSASNSLVGSTNGDMVCRYAIALTNGDYVASSPLWHNGSVVDAGAATWGDGISGTTGSVSVANSLVGNHAYDNVGEFTSALTNGNYVVSSPWWDNGTVVDAGAVSRGIGATGTVGVVSTANSLVGSKDNDWVGVNAVTILSNGNYVVNSPLWDNGAITDAGAVTWGDGVSGTTGVVFTGNSLVGNHNDDRIGNFVTALNNGNYVVGSPYWKNGAISEAGAATWVNGASSFAGVVSVANSLVGNKTEDHVSLYGVFALKNGNYVVDSPDWDNGAAANAGAATWGDGASGITGPVSPSNSLVGAAAGDKIGSKGVMALTNGNYVVLSPEWSFGGVINAGAVTWGNGASGVVGLISSTNSLVGSHMGDEVSFGSATALGNGNYIVLSPFWDSSGTTNAGAVTWGWGVGGTIGAITQQNSVVGTAINGGVTMVYAYDAVNTQLVVGRPVDNIVTVFRLHGLNLPIVKNQ